MIVYLLMNFLFVFVYGEVIVYLLKVQMAAVSVVPAILDFLSDEVGGCDMYHHVLDSALVLLSITFT